MTLDLLHGHRANRLTILDCGTFSVRGGERIIGIPAYLIETDQGARILVDGGFPPAYLTDEPAAAKADGLAAFGSLVAYSRHQTLPDQLALAGTSLPDITLHILTHGHIDHVGALPLIRCPLVVTRTERADPRPRYFGNARPIDWPDVPTHLVDELTVLCHGITLIPTPGHTPGHMSLQVDLPASGTLILAADAINRASEPAEHFADAADPASARTSANGLFALQQKTGGTLIYGHDPTQWADLPKAPQHFR